MSKSAQNSHYGQFYNPSSRISPRKTAQFNGNASKTSFLESGSSPEHQRSPRDQSESAYEQIVQKLKHQLKRTKYPREFHFYDLSKGNFKCLVPVIHHALTGFSQIVCKHLDAKGFKLSLVSDFTFMEEVFEICTSVFNFKPSISIAEFFGSG